MADLKEAAETIQRHLRLHTHPLALKFLDDAAAIPSDIRRPSIFGVKMAFCQIVSIARRWGWSFAVTPDDVNCAAALLSFGWGKLAEDADEEEELIDFRVDAGYVRDREAAIKNLEEVASRTDESTFSARALILSPLDSGVVQDPDVVLIYGNPAQMARMVQSMIYTEGGVIESWSNIGASCVREMIAPMIEDKAGYVIPGRGARQLGMVADDEMVFTLPVGKLESLLIGLRETHRKGTKYPINQFLFFEPRFNETVEAFREKIQPKK